MKDHLTGIVIVGAALYSLLYFITLLGIGTQGINRGERWCQKPTTINYFRAVPVKVLYCWLIKKEV